MEDNAPIVLSNGTLKDPITGRFLKGSRPTTGIMPGDSNRAREMNQRRQVLAQQKARAKMVEAYTEHTGRPGGQPSDAYGEIAGEFTRSALANAMDKPRDAVHAAKLALRLAAMLPEDEKRTVPVVAIQINHIGADVAALADD